jgi:hypothetical protein
VQEEPWERLPPRLEDANERAGITRAAALQWSSGAISMNETPLQNASHVLSKDGARMELGTAREVVFRALRALADRRVVRTGRARLQILDRVGLTRVARRS